MIQQRFERIERAAARAFVDAQYQAQKYIALEKASRTLIERKEVVAQAREHLKELDKQMRKLGAVDADCRGSLIVYDPSVGKDIYYYEAPTFKELVDRVRVVQNRLDKSGPRLS